MGELRPDVAPDLRSFSEGSYVVDFRALLDGIEVARVLHGARNIESLF
jgi:toxin ParE1/3/4